MSNVLTPTPSLPEGPGEMPADSLRRVLVVVDQPCTAPELCARLRAHAGNEPIEALVIAPASGGETQWYVDEDAAHAHATHRLRACLACLARGGIRAGGRLGDPDPVQAIADALFDFPADEILLVSAAERPSSWLRESVVDRARHAFEQPVEHVVMPARPPRREPMNVLVTAASEQGATAEIAAAIGRVLRERGFDCAVRRPEEIDDVGRYDAAVIGSAVYAGHWLAPATELVDRFAHELEQRPVWLFSSGPVGDPNRKLVQKMTADPFELPTLLAQTNAREHRILAGKLTTNGLGGPQRLSLLLFRGMQGDWRDWAEIEGFATAIADALDTSTPQTEPARPSVGEAV